MPDRAARAADGPTANLYAWAVSLIASVLAVGNITLGVIVAGWPERLSSNSFAHITGGTTARADLWGAAFVLSGVVGLFGQWTHRMWPARLAHTASAFGCLYWVGAFAAAGMESPTVSLTGCVAYGLLACLHGIAAVVSPHRP